MTFLKSCRLLERVSLLPIIVWSLTVFHAVDVDQKAYFHIRVQLFMLSKMTCLLGTRNVLYLDACHRPCMHRCTATFITGVDRLPCHEKTCTNFLLPTAVSTSTVYVRFCLQSCKALRDRVLRVRTVSVKYGDDVSPASLKALTLALEHNSDVRLKFYKSRADEGGLSTPLQLKDILVDSALSRGSLMLTGLTRLVLLVS